MTQKNAMNALQSGLLPFDPIVLILDVAKHWLAIVLVVLMAGMGSYIYTDVTYIPQYKTTMTFVVSDCSSDSSVYSNLSTTTGLASVFSEMLSSSILRSTILEKLGDTTFDGTISASVIPETNLLTVTVTSNTPRTTFLVAQAVVDHHHTLTYQVIDGVALEILQPPSVPLTASNPEGHLNSMKKIMIIAAVAAFILMIYISYSKNTIRSGTKTKKKLNCNYLGEIPHEHKKLSLLSRIRRHKTSILITNPLTSFHYIESIRKIRHRVVQRMHGKKVLMVTSLLENEGKSTVSVNLALSLAQKYPKVLLIDCDLKKPACHLLLGRKKIAKGLTDVLVKSTPLSDAILENKKRKDIAKQLNLSENTVKTYTRGLYKKLGVANREELNNLL